MLAGGETLDGEVGIFVGLIVPAQIVAEAQRDFDALVARYRPAMANCTSRILTLLSKAHFEKNCSIALSWLLVSAFIG
jgi:hypothetical protein